MSEFKKKAKTEGPRIYRVRDIFEIFKHGKATIRIVKRPLSNACETWSESAKWDYWEKAYDLRTLSTTILDSIIFDAEITDNGDTIKVFI